jgi:hypothetical protein
MLRFHTSAFHLFPRQAWGRSSRDCAPQERSNDTGTVDACLHCPSLPVRVSNVNLHQESAVCVKSPILQKGFSKRRGFSPLPVGSEKIAAQRCGG